MLSARDATETQWRVLRSLYERGEMEALELAQVSAIMAPSLTRMLKVLEERGLVTIRHPTDCRHVLISISPAGRDFMSEALPEMQRIYGQLSLAIDSDRVRNLQKLLKEVAELASSLGPQTQVTFIDAMLFRRKPGLAMAKCWPWADGYRWFWAPGQQRAGTPCDL